MIGHPAAGDCGRTKTPKVKELARELGISARELIDRCRAEGIWVQNSVTRLDRDVVPTIRAWFESQPEQREERPS
jgi:hypothetical protein